MNTDNAIKPDSEICQTLTCLPEKFVVDFANGIDVTQDHLRTQRARGGIFQRLYDGFTGQGYRRQNETNANLAKGVEASLQWLTELTESLAHSNLALAQVNDRINSLKHDTALIAHYSADTRQRLDSLALRLDERCHEIEQELSRIDFTQRAALNLDRVFNRWRAGRFQSFSLAGRCYAALEELRWGDFGDFCRARPQDVQTGNFLKDLSNRIIFQLAEDSGQKRSDRFAIGQWLEPPTGRTVIPDAQAALAYLGDNFSPDSKPFIFTVSQAPEQLPLEVPRIGSAERLGEALLAEVFEGVRYA